MPPIDFIETRLLYNLFEIIGTIAFAFSGIKVASSSQYDIFGGIVLSMCVAVGGGTVRDCMLGVRPFWTTDIIYLLCALFALVMFFVLKHRVIPRIWDWVDSLWEKDTTTHYHGVFGKLFSISDTIGLALFTIAGAQKTEAAGLPIIWTAVIMGVITGCMGGVIRDVFAGLKPAIFSSEFYATASFLGAVIYYIMLRAGIPIDLCSIVGMISIVALRFIAMRYRWHLPML